MFRNRLKSLITVPVMAGVLLLTACQASGGGTLPSASSCSVGGQAGATFGFNVFQPFDPTASPDSLPISFAGNLTDRCAGVMLKTSGRMTPIARPDITPPQFNSCLFGTATYDSVNPARPGSGTMNLLVCDQTGRPATDSADFIVITMPNTLILGVDDAGPYKDYINSGVLTIGRSPTPAIGQGNIVVRL